MLLSVALCIVTGFFSRDLNESDLLSSKFSSTFNETDFLLSKVPGEFNEIDFLSSKLSSKLNDFDFLLSNLFFISLLKANFLASKFPAISLSTSFVSAISLSASCFTASFSSN